jgi:hypothetical protein
MTLLGLLAVETDTVADSVDSTGVQVAAASAEPNDLRWDLAKAFGFDWESTELWTKVLKGVDPNTPTWTLVLSIRPGILNSKRLVVIDVNNPAISQIRDEHGNDIKCRPGKTVDVRGYQHKGWYWHDGMADYGMSELASFSLTIPLAADPNQHMPSSISELTAYVYAIYADEVVDLDIPFDPDGGWVESKVVPALMQRVDPTTPPCPGPLQYVNLSPTGSRFGPFRPRTPVPLYECETWVKTKAGGPVMAVRDAMPWFPRRLYPLGDYAVVRTELYDSKEGRSSPFYQQMFLSDPTGEQGAHCWGRMEQIPGDTYDSIRHVIAVHPVEVKIPFVLRNIPIPKLQLAAK